MTGLVLADTVLIAGGFADSLGQALTSPWMLAVPAALMLAVSLWLRRRSRRMPLVLLPPLPVHVTEPCPWCDDPECIDSSLCGCQVPCGRGYCKAVQGA